MALSSELGGYRVYYLGGEFLLGGKERLQTRPLCEDYCNIGRKEIGRLTGLLEYPNSKGFKPQHRPQTIKMFFRIGDI